MNSSIVKLLEDRLYIKATQQLRRHLTPKEFREFFIKNKYKLESTQRQLIKDLDKLINEFLESLK